MYESMQTAATCRTSALFLPLSVFVIFPLFTPDFQIRSDFIDHCFLFGEGNLILFGFMFWRNRIW